MRETSAMSRPLRNALFVAQALVLGAGVGACQGLLGVDFDNARPIGAPVSDGGGDAADDAVRVDPGCQASCAGCCVGSACQPGTTDDACGLSGAACKECGSRTCKAGACAPTVVLFGGNWAAARRPAIHGGGMARRGSSCPSSAPSRATPRWEHRLEESSFSSAAPRQARSRTRMTRGTGTVRPGRSTM